MEHLIGKTLNRYQIIELLGEGGMGAVFKAYDQTLERYVAVKVLYPQYARQPNFQQRFLQEARSAARLDHPGIVQVHDFGQDHSFPFIVMEYIPGDNLEQMLRQLREQGGWIPLNEAAELVRQLCLAIDYAHRQGVLHRDIKPSNIMLEPEPIGELPFRPVITDLGLARLAEGGSLTQEGGFFGTPAYISPEQASGLPTDERSDVYSLGILLFELSTGQKPFPAKTISEAILYHSQTPAPAPTTLRPDLPEELEKIILQAIEKDPSKRFDSAGKLAEAIHKALPLFSAIYSGADLSTTSLVTQIKPRPVQGEKPFFNAGVVSSSAAATILRADGTAVRKDLLYTSPGLGKVMVYAENLQISCDPGRSQALPLIVLNRSDSADRFHLSVSGLPGHWLSYPTQPVPVLPGAQQDLSLLIHPPKTPESRAGRYPLTILITSQSAPTERVELRAIVTVTKFSQFSSELHPRTLHIDEVGQLHLRNLGNTPEGFHIQWGDSGDEIEFDPPQLQLNILEGQTAIAEYRPVLRKASWFGDARSHFFSARVTPASGGPQVLEGELREKPKSPVWLLPLLLFGCLLGAGLLLVFSGFLLGGPNQAAERTVRAKTELAGLVQSTQQSGTATALYLTNANQATINAVTATAYWLSGDDDRDGLSNATELELNTRPDKADTDMDGLSDGDEVHIYHTDPLNPDSDGDGLKDGEEIAAGLDPNNPDTDGDGIIDSLDEAPLQTSTPTANAVATLAAALTETSSSRQETQAATQTAQVVASSATSQSATLTAIASSPQTWTLPVELLSNQTAFNLRLTRPGQIRVRLTWTGTQDLLTLSIHRADKAYAYAYEEGVTGLEVAYTVTPSDFASGDHWRVTITSTGSGEAQGKAEFFFPGGDIDYPFAVEFTINPTTARSISLIFLRDNGMVSANAEWTGVPAQLALILNGTGQAGSYTRQDGASPLSLSYKVSPADFGTGNVWLVSLVSLQPSDLRGNLVIDYP